jgi:pimeloyl-ACP methyl ester carboxylesterase
MDHVGYERAVLVGHSAGAAIAVLAADRHPERVAGLVLVAPAIYQSRPLPSWLTAVLSTPQMRRIGPVFARSLGGESGRATKGNAFYDPSFLTPELLDGYDIGSRVENWDLALWEFTLAPRPDDPVEALEGIEAPVLVVAGTEDGTVPYEDSVSISEQIPGAQLATYERTAHVPHEEQTERFIEDVTRFLEESVVQCGGP